MRWTRRSKTQAADALREAVGDHTLPHFSGAVLQALSTLRDDGSTLEEIAETLNFDPGVSVKLLALVNSSAFGARATVDDLPQAIQLVGRASLESLLISMSVRKALPEKTSGIDTSAFWRAAAYRAVVARRLAQELCPREAHSAFTAALLQDMAVPLLAERQGDAYLALLERWREGGPSLRELEREAFGCDHAELGLLMCQAWELPESLAMAIGGHHDDPGDDNPTPDPVLLSSLLREPGPAPGSDELVAVARDRHGLEDGAVSDLLDACLGDAEDLGRLFA